MFKFFKKTEIVITNKEELITVLTKISGILSDNGFHEQANAVNKPLQYLQIDDKENFLTSLKTVDIWGGSGSAREVGSFANEQQEIKFESSFVELASLLKNTGIKFKPANDIANTFKKDLYQKKKNGS